VLAPGFYARQDIRTPVKIGVVTLVLTQVMNLLFIYPLAHAGLALAIGLGACINAGLLYFKLRRGGIFTPQPGWRKFFLQLGVALVAMGRSSGSPAAAPRAGSKDRSGCVSDVWRQSWQPAPQCTSRCYGRAASVSCSSPREPSEAACIG
jgi:hypothetical protein